MRLFPNAHLRSLAAVSLASGALFAAGYELAERGSDVEALLYREAEIPGGPALIRRPPREARAELDRRIAEAPDETQLYALRAEQAERALDFDAAEADWKRYAELVEGPAAGAEALASFFRRRLRPLEEVDSLLNLARQPSPPSERFAPAAEQRSWKAFVRMEETCRDHLLDEETRRSVYRAWLGRYPSSQDPYRRLLSYLQERKRWAAISDLLEEYAAVFPQDSFFLLEARAEALAAQSGASQALTVYEEDLDSLWPSGLWVRYFDLLERADRVRSELDVRRARLADNPDDLLSAAWLFHYRNRQGDAAAARRALTEYRRSKEERQADWTPNELRTLAALARSTNDVNEAARYLYALYSLPASAAANREHALAGLIETLLVSPEQPIRFGSGDLSFYRDVATADENPGFLNGVLSLLLNSEGLDWRFDNQERTAGTYFRRAAAEELVLRFNREFPASTRRSALRARLIEVYALYGENDGVVSFGEAFLSEFPDAPQRSDVSLWIAEAYARQGRIDEELAAYDALLVELAERADGAPLGPGVVGPDIGQRRYGTNTGPRSPAYARVFDRAVARYVALKRLPDALRLHAGEIARNPDDPGLYERLASFLDANGYADRVEAVYRQAIGRFEDRSWHHKLARWYLRRQRTADLERLTREAVDAFSGTELADYFARVVGSGIDDRLHLELNLYAHQRFPHHLAFVRRLLRIYSSPRTRDDAAWEDLIRRHWHYAEDLRASYLAYLSGMGKLETELTRLETSLEGASAGEWNSAARANPAAAQLLAEGRMWRCRFEDAAEPMLALAAEAPSEAMWASRAAELHRSLAYANPFHTDVAAGIVEGLSAARPAEADLLARIGDTFADRELYGRAQPYWSRMGGLRPGRAAGYVEAATVFWDYYFFEEALQVLRQGREALGSPALFAYEAGAVEESRGDRDAAVREYIQGALALDPSYPARNRLTALARRASMRESIAETTAGLAGGRNPSPAALSLHVSVLEAQELRDELAGFLENAAERTTSLTVLDEVDRIASSRALSPARETALRRRLELLQDPVERMRLRLSLVGLLESRKDFDAAEQESARLYADAPLILGVVRARTDFLWRRDRKPDAIATLLEAADASYDVQRRRFVFEAADKEKQRGEYPRSRALLAGLLDEQPFQAQYLSAMADAYAREGLDEELRTFYEEQLSTLSESDKSAAERRALTASLRRALIPALTRLEDHSSAVDQYIELINRSPENQVLVDETTAYALRHDQRERLQAFYEKTTIESPQDVRYHRVLGRIRARAGDFSGAIVAYENALKVRPDDQTVLEARLDLEQRLLRLDAARDTIERLYEASHENPVWMQRLVAIEARRGDVEAAERAARAAYIDRRPERAESFFAAAGALADNGLDEPAWRLAEQGVELAGTDLLLYGESLQGARLYARLGARLRRHEVAWERTRRALPAETNGYHWSRWSGVVADLAGTARRFYPPEEKQRFANFLEERRTAASPEELDQALLPAVQSAGWAETETRWRFERMLAAGTMQQASRDQARFIALQRARGLHLELGRQLERIYSTLTGPNRNTLLRAAADAYRDAGVVDEEFRVRERLGSISERYLELLLARNPERLVALAANLGSERAAEWSLLRAEPELALRVIQSYYARKQALWRNAYGTVAGLYRSHWNDGVADGMAEALGDAIIDDRLGAAVDRESRFAGDLWYSYAAIFGEQRVRLGHLDEAQYRLAALERSPARAERYFDLAELYRATGQGAEAEADYRRVLELRADDPVSLDRLGRIAHDDGRTEEALELWRRAFEAYEARIDRYDFAPDFWRELPSLFRALSRREQLDALGDETNQVVAAYLQRNGAFRIEELLRPLAEASVLTPDRLFGWAEPAPNPLELLALTARAAWLDEAIRGELYERGSALALERYTDQQQGYLLGALYDWRREHIEFLLADGRAGEARRVFDATLPTVGRRLLTERFDLVARLFGASLEDALAALDEALPGVQSATTLAQAAEQLRSDQIGELAERLSEVRYERLLAANQAASADILGLAEIRLRQNRRSEALEMIAGVLLSLDDPPFAHHEAASRLLLDQTETEQAARLLAELTAWEPSNRRARLLRARAVSEVDGAHQARVAVASDEGAEYAVRVEAARALTSSGIAATNLGSAELQALATPSSMEAVAAAPYFRDARLAAGEATEEPARRASLLQSALSIGDPDAPPLRFAIFDAAIAADNPTLALSALDPMLRSGALGGMLRREDSLFDESDSSNSVDGWVAEQFLASHGLSPSRRAEVAAATADALRTLNRSSAAADFYSVALSLDPSAGAAADWSRQLDLLRTARRLRAENARRRPRIRDRLFLESPITPMLTTLEEAAP